MSAHRHIKSARAPLPPTAAERFWMAQREALLIQIVSIEKEHLPGLAMPVWKALELAKTNRPGNGTDEG